MQALSYKTLLVSVDAGVATVTLNRPERRNALGARMTNELLYALEDAATAGDVRCTMLTGAGSAFCAGADLGELGGDADALELPPKGGYDDLLRMMLRASKPILEASSVAIALGLSATNEVDGRSVEDKLPLLARRLLECLATDDAREGLAAFVEKRPPRWTQR